MNKSYIAIAISLVALIISGLTFYENYIKSSDLQYELDPTAIKWCSLLGYEGVVYEISTNIFISNKGSREALIFARGFEVMPSFSGQMNLEQGFNGVTIPPRESKSLNLTAYLNPTEAQNVSLQFYVSYFDGKTKEIHFTPRTISLDTSEENCSVMWYRVV